MKQAIVFNNNKQNFALEIERIERIIEYSSPKKLPDTAEYILGIIKYNEKVLPVIDLNHRLYGSSGELCETSKIIVVIWKSALLGLVVDDVIGIKTVDEEAFEEFQMGEENVSSEYIRGFIKLEEDIIILMDTEKLFSFIQAKEILELKEETEEVM